MTQSTLHRLALCTCLVLATGPKPALALDPGIRVDQFDLTTWGRVDGAPSDAWTIVQDRDGWLWIGGAAGLYRFDGVRFEHVDSRPEGPVHFPAVSELRPTESGDLWIGYRDGGATRLRDGQFTSFPVSSGLPAGSSVAQLLLDTSGNLWAVAADGLYLFDGKRWTPPAASFGVPTTKVDAMSIDSSGTMRVLAQKAMWVRQPGASHFERGPAIDAEFFEEAPDGRTWYSTKRSMLTVFPGQPAVIPTPVRFATFGLASILYDREGSVWYSKDGTLMRVGIPAGAASIPMPTASSVEAGTGRIPAKDVQVLFEDRDDNVWMKSAPGVQRLRDAVIHRVSPEDETVGTPRGSIMADGNAVFLGDSTAEEAGTHRLGVWRVGASETKLQASEIARGSLLAPGHDGVWLATWNAIWQEHDGHFIKVADLPQPPADSPASNGPLHPLAMAEDPARGGLWVGIQQFGTFFLKDGQWTRHPELNGAHTPVAFSVDAAGVLWASYLNSKLLRVDSHGVTEIPSEDFGVVHAISAGRRMLLGGVAGLAVLDQGKLRMLSASDATLLTGVGAILQEANGDVWLNAANGLVRIKSADLDAALSTGSLRVPVRMIGADEGYPGAGGLPIPFCFHSLTQTEDGRIWFSGRDGTGWIDPRKVAAEPPPHLALRAIGVGKADPHLFAGGPLDLAAGTRDLQLQYTALNYTHPERQRFRYRLVGQDDAWTDAGTRREAFYSNLGPGHYRFELQGSNEGNDWTTQPLTLAIDIAPTFLQSKIFFALCVLAALLLATWAIRLRVRQLAARERAKLDERYRERERIARELHDTLLQSAQGVVMLLEGATTRLPSGDPLRQPLERAAAVGRAGITEGRDRIRELSASNRPSAELLASLGELAGELSRSSGITHAVRIEGAPRALKAAAADEVLLIAREALLNAFRHSQASHVQLVQTYADDAFTIEVADDGRGIPAQVLSAGGVQDHWGLPGMRTRAERLGAAFDIASRPGLGTRVTLRLPAELAYDRPASRRWYALLRA